MSQSNILSTSKFLQQNADVPQVYPEIFTKSKRNVSEIRTMVDIMNILGDYVTIPTAFIKKDKSLNYDYKVNIKDTPSTFMAIGTYWNSNLYKKHIKGNNQSTVINFSCNNTKIPIYVPKNESGQPDKNWLTANDAENIGIFCTNALVENSIKSEFSIAMTPKARTVISDTNIDGITEYYADKVSEENISQSDVIKSINVASARQSNPWINTDYYNPEIIVAFNAMSTFTNPKSTQTAKQIVLKKINQVVKNNVEFDAGMCSDLMGFFGKGDGFDEQNIMDMIRATKGGKIVKQYTRSKTVLTLTGGISSNEDEA